LFIILACRSLSYTPFDKEFPELVKFYDKVKEMGITVGQLYQALESTFKKSSDTFYSINYSDRYFDDVLKVLNNT
jgi:hypothetical protein